MISHPLAIICRSDDRAPSRLRADSAYALMMHSSIMICCCCRADRSVQRPWRIKVTTLSTEGVLEVNGAATDASPGRTMGSASSRPASGSSAAPSPPSTLPVDESKRLPCFLLNSRFSFCISTCIRTR